jgi:hypothetical protein
MALLQARCWQEQPDQAAGWAHVNSHEESHPEASYYVRWREGKRTIWRRCESLGDAVAEAELKRAVLVARVHGVAVEGIPKTGL